MATFKVETKNKVDIDKKPRVYFTCHPDDFDRHFKKVRDDIFKTHDCAVYYTESMTEFIAEDEKETDLGRHNLFVVPVTYRLLSTPNRAMDEDIPYAFRKHIPVLPIMMESGIDEIYSKPDKFGELQYLNPYSTDLTEISYEDKLKKYLESVLISDELANRVRAAFDAYIFLSYRKKDRKYANELMRLIHSIPECRDIAIWFDEFLTPGESFKENIEKIVGDCDLFTLLVTPRLLEKVVDKDGAERDNYVISTELPLARKKKEEKGTDILAVQMESTDKEALLSINIEDCVNSDDSEFRTRLTNTISRLATTANNTPEHNFLIGLAYLDGIDVEVDKENAVSLITSAAENGLKEAIKKLADMYFDGDSVKREPNTAIYWYDRIIKLQAEIYEASRSRQDFLELIDSMDNLGDRYEQLRRNKDAADIYQKCIDMFHEYPADGEDVTLLRMQCYLLNRYGYALKLIGNNSQAFETYKKAYEIALEIQNDSTADGDLVRLVRSIVGLATICEEQYDTKEAMRLFNDSLELLEKINNKTSQEYFDISSQVYQKIGDAYFKHDDFSEALENYRKSLDNKLKIVSEDDSLVSRLNLAINHNKIGHSLLGLGEECSATEEYLASFEIILDIHKDTPTIEVRRQLMIVSGHLGKINVNRKNYDLAEEFYQDALGIAHDLAETYGTVEFLNDMRVSCDNLATLYEEINQLNKSLTLRFKELEYAQKVVDITHSRKDLMSLSIVHNNLGGLLRKFERADLALEQYLLAYGLRKELAKRNEPFFLEALLVDCYSIAEILVELENVIEAKGYYAEAVDVCEKLVELVPCAHKYDLLGTAYVQLASVENDDGQYELLRKAVDIYRKLSAEDPDNQRIRNDREALEEAVAEMDRERKRKIGFFKRLLGIFRKNGKN